MPYRGVFIMSPAQKDNNIDLEELLEKAKRVSQEAEVFYVHHRDEPVLFEANRVKLVESRESSGVSLRVIKDGKVGFSSTSDFRDTDSLVNNTMEMVPFGPEARLEFPTYSSFSPVEIYDPRTESFPMDQMVNLGQTAIDCLVGSNSDLVCDASVSKGVTTITVLNSRGGYATYTKSIFALGVSGTLIKDTDMLFVSDGKSSCRPITDASEIVATVEQQYVGDCRHCGEATGILQKHRTRSCGPGAGDIYPKGSKGGAAGATDGGI
jgi:PmbA protein